MIILHVIVDNEVRQYALVGGTSYTIGRRGCQIQLPQHPSVSRHHATITVLPTGASESASLDSVPTVLIADVSKHGTTVNGELLSTSEAHRPLHLGDLVVFGTAVKMRLLHLPIVACISGSLTREEAKSAVDNVCKIGGCIREMPLSREEILASNMSPFATLYVARELDDDPVCLLAVMNGYTAVSPQYLTTLFTAVRETPGTDLSSLPHPHAFDVPMPTALAGCKYVRPERCTFGPGDYAHSPQPTASIFRSRHFVFLEGDCDPMIHSVVQTGDGSMSQVSEDAWARWQASSIASDTLPLRGLLPDHHCHGLNVIFVASAAVYNALEHSVASATADATETRIWQLTALSRLFRLDYPIVNVGNLTRAVLSRDSADQLLNRSAPGVLCRSSGEEFAGSSDDADSNATTDGIGAFRFAPRQSTAVAPSCEGASRRSEHVSSKRSPDASTRAPEVVRRDQSERDLYSEWKSFRRTDTQASRPSEASTASPRVQGRKKKQNTLDFRHDFESKIEGMRKQVLHLADRAVDNGFLRPTDASLLDTIHQRVVNYLDWVKVDDQYRFQLTDTQHRAAAESLLQCVEVTLSSCPVATSPR